MNIRTKKIAGKGWPQWVKTALVLAAIFLAIEIAWLNFAGHLVPSSDPEVAEALSGVLWKGWLNHVGRMREAIQVRSGMIATAVALSIIFVAGSHGFLRWLYGESSVTGEAAPRRWRWGWTLGLFGLIVLMFVCGLSSAGLVRHVEWLMHSPTPLYYKSHRYEFVFRGLCQENFDEIHRALHHYAQGHDHRYPDDFSVLALSDGELSAEAYFCHANWGWSKRPSGNGTRALSESLKDPQRCSYVYLGKGLIEPVDANRVVVIEPLENHGNGTTVLYGDGRVAWLDQPEARKVLEKLGIKEHDQTYVGLEP